MVMFKDDIWLICDPDEYEPVVCESEKDAIKILIKWKREDKKFWRIVKYIGPVHYSRVL